MEKTYELVVKTNCYAGNFEREMCAFMTGQIGDEDDTGHEFVELEVSAMFDGKVSGKADENGTWRPVEANGNNFTIFLEKPLSNEDMKFLDERAKLFETNRPYSYLDEKFKYLGIEQYEIETEVKRKKTLIWISLNLRMLMNFSMNGKLDLKLREESVGYLVI